MPDILTLWNTTRGDWQRAGGSLASGNDIVTSVLISLFTDRVATPDDLVPDATRKLRDPRGWWADELIGSRLWLIDRAKRTQATLQRAQAYIVEALQWLVDDDVASRIEVTTEWTRQDTLGALVVVYSPRTGAPLVKIGTQNLFRLPDAQAWGWNIERGVGQWVELNPSKAMQLIGEQMLIRFRSATSELQYLSQYQTFQNTLRSGIPVVAIGGGFDPANCSSRIVLSESNKVANITGTGAAAVLTSQTWYGPADDKASVVEFEILTGGTARYYIGGHAVSGGPAFSPDADMQGSLNAGGYRRDGTAFSTDGSTSGEVGGAGHIYTPLASSDVIGLLAYGPVFYFVNGVRVAALPAIGYGGPSIRIYPMIARY